MAGSDKAWPEVCSEVPDDASVEDVMERLSADESETVRSLVRWKASLQPTS